MVKVGIIGAGNMAQEHARAFADIPGTELAGLYSRTDGKAKALAAKYGVPSVCDSIAELYQKTQAQLVVIAVSELSVGEVCLEAFKYPWTCLVEKPAGYNAVDADAIAAAARQHERQAFVALNRRHYSSTRIVMEDLSASEGQRLIHVYDQEDSNAARKLGRPELVVRNWMFANSIHVIDYLQLLGRGEVTTVEPTIRWNPEEPRFVAAKVSFSSGDIGLYEAVWNGPGPWAVTVTTQQKRWELRPLEQAAFQPYGSRKLEPIAVHEWDTKFKPGFRAQAEEAVKAAQGHAHTLPTLEEALVSMRLVKRIYA